MLLNKDYDQGDIVSFKMVNGDEVVAKIIELGADSWKVAKPCTVIPGPQGIGLIQSLISADINTEVILNKQHVMLHAPVIAQMKDHYIQTTTGIQPVREGQIVL